MSDPVVKPLDSLVAETRRQIQPYVFRRLEARRPRQPGAKIAHTITVSSGKGGVGKTNIVANLAIALGQANRRVIILDADLGLANIDVVFGIRPKRNLTDVINGTHSLDEILIPGPCGIQIIAGGSGISELAHLSPEQARRLFDQLRFLEDKADYLLIDTGAGINQNVIRFCLAADRIIVVTTPEPTALADAYGIIKVISQSRPTSHVSVLVNRAESEAEATFIQERLETVARDFLKFPVHRLGYLPNDPNMYLAVRQQTPLLLFSPMSPAATRLRAIVSEAFHEAVTVTAPKSGIEGFLERLTELFGGGGSAA
ncbi:MAG: Flagellar synthesis regulator FleN [Candidatus Ozemobacter sibiricus]|jgi:flagellar biosynthesis protein FlhG|uniref:Flagellar synthesis regulator FleN n=1 Tax=Candidatus Ozemobacter sibiricus TaxID=2268124 RepID=A0A367ZCY6_9BACT|nr:MAG: Flagellar synthesis regulator FleN [Candidatus Ozemobacter sibiricus]